LTLPHVTVGMPVHQGERFVDEAIRSIRAQTFTDLELVISDNGSTDGTQSICRAHAAEDPRVVYHRSEVNRGAAWNYSRLVGLARGRYFKWASHDDLLRPEYLERCVATLEADPDVVLCQTGAAAIDSDGNEVGRWPPNANASDGRPSQRFADILFREGPCFPVFGLIRQEVLKRTGLLGAYNAHDRPLMAELALHGRYAHVPEVLFLNREHPERSIRAYRGPRERIAWFDPAMEGRVVYFYPRLVLEYHRAVVRSGVPVEELIRAEALLAAWTVRHLPGLTRNVLGGLRVHARRAIASRRIHGGMERS
jgi:glycosyltransferase involved in cell wall biosynthesis